MASIHFSALLSILLFYFCYRQLTVSGRKLPGNRKQAILVFFAIALLIRMVAAVLSKGFDSDTACFAAWADRIYNVGFAEFYSPDVFTDYPPGYIYLLYPIGAIRTLLHLEYYSPIHLLLLRLPAICCDMITGWLIFREADKRWGKTLRPFLFAGVYLLNPAVLLNAAIWGQVDSVYTLLLVLICLCLVNGKTIPTYFLFCIGILIKPQMLIFAPVLLIGYLKLILFKNFSWIRLLQNIFACLLAVLADLLLILPFGISNVTSQYVSTVSSYPYAAVNACNLWGLFGQNWISQDTTFLGVPFTVYGYLGIFVFVVITFVYAFVNKRNKTIYPLLCSILMAGTFCFSVRMHERYLYPAVILLLFACIYNPTKQLYATYCSFSLFHFYNTAFVLFFYDPNSYDRKAPLLLLVSAGTLASLIYFLIILLRKGKPDDLFAAKASEAKEVERNKAKHSAHLPSFTPSAQLAKLTLVDLALLLAITAMYACFAFRDLGNREAPESALKCTSGQTIDLVFSTDSLPRQMSYYTALPEDIDLQFSVKNPGEEEWLDSGKLTLYNVFTWSTAELPLDTDEDPAYFYAYDFITYRFTVNENKASIIELVFLDEEDNIVLPDNWDQYLNLFDEQSYFPERSSYRNSMYFDEIYHARTAYEFLNGEITYENTHPPLGKIIIALGIKLFGMNPFGWRFMGTLFGVLMVPVVYLFGKELFGHTSLAAFSAFLYAFDFMHFTQTRIATIDVYISFFVMLMYFFLYRYCKLSIYDRPLRSTFLPLGACGICMGLGVACKWTGVYAGVGLAVIFFLHLLQEYQEAQSRINATSTSRSLDKKGAWARTFPTKFWKTIAFCLIFFVCIPFGIYLLSYIPFKDYSQDGLLQRMLHNQESMLSYHSNLEATHPYSSSWYEWPTMIRPTWYYSSVVSGVGGAGGLREGISAFGNPLVWWVGIPIVFYMLFLAIKKKDKTATFLLIGYFAQYLPWFLVTRVTFIYHYFPSVVFVVFMIAYSLKTLKTQISKAMFLTIIVTYCLAAFLLFYMFYPVLAGQTVEASYVLTYLRWLKDWVLVSS